MPFNFTRHSMSYNHKKKKKKSNLRNLAFWPYFSDQAAKMATMLTSSFHSHWKVSCLWDVLCSRFITWLFPKPCYSQRVLFVRTLSIENQVWSFPSLSFLDNIKRLRRKCSYSWKFIHICVGSMSLVTLHSAEGFLKNVQ